MLPWNWRRFARCAAVLAAAVLADSAAAADPKIRVLQAVDLPANLPFWIALEHGFFRKRGLDVEIVRDDAPGVADRIAGKIQFGIVGVPAIMNGVAQGRDLKMLFPIYAPRSTQVLVARPAIKAASDLRGKKLAVFTVGTGFWIQSMLALEQLGIDPAKDGISFVQVGNLSRQVDALRAGTVDAAMVDAGRAQQLGSEGYTILLDMFPANILGSQSGLCVSGALLRGEPETVKRFVEAYFEAAAFSFAPVNRDTVLKTLGARLDLSSAAAMQSAYAVFQRSVERKPYASLEAMRNMQRIMATVDPRVLQLRPEDAIDDRIVRAMDLSDAIDGFYRERGQ